MGYLDEVLQAARTARSTRAAERSFPSRSPVAAASPMGSPVSEAVRPKANMGDKPGEMRLSMARPLASFKKGTDYVPKTGIYELHEGEKVLTKEENKMDAKSAMQDITGKKSKPAKKIKEIRTKKTDDGKFVHTHLHHSPEHHADEVHVSNNLKEAQQHLADNESNITPQAPPPDAEAAEGAAPGGAAPTTPGM